MTFRRFEDHWTITTKETIMTAPEAPTVEQARTVALDLLSRARFGDIDQTAPVAPPWFKLVVAGYLVRFIAGRTREGLGRDNPVLAEHTIRQARCAVNWAKATGLYHLGEADAAEQLVLLAEIHHRSWGANPAVPPGLAAGMARSFVNGHTETEVAAVVTSAVQFLKFIADMVGDADLLLDAASACGLVENTDTEGDSQ